MELIEAFFHDAQANWDVVLLDLFYKSYSEVSLVNHCYMCVCGYFTACIIMRWCAISILTLRTQVIHELLVHRACGFVAGIVALMCVHRCLSVSREQQMRSCWSFRIGAMQSWDDTNLL